MKRLLLDVDEVICQSEFLHHINLFTNKNYKLEDFTTYYIEDQVFKTEQEKLKFYEYIKDIDMYKNATLLPKAYETIKKLNEKYDIYICSACIMDIHDLKMFSGIYFKHKYDFLIKTFPFLDVNKFIFTNTKNIFNTDIQIDDKLSNLQSNVPTRLLFSSYHNHDISQEKLKENNIQMVNSWDDIAKILL